MHFQFIFLAIIMGVLRRVLRSKQLFPEWQKILLGGIIVSISVLLLEARFPVIHPYTSWLGYLLMFAVFWLVYKIPAFASIKRWLNVVLPFIAVGFIESLAKAIVPQFYETNKQYFDVAGVFALVWMMVMVFVTNKQQKALALEKRKAEARERELKITEEMKAQLEIQVAERTSEIMQQKQSLEKAILDLQATQAQLIQAEKMASLGELTAGIAHEIQNPLNFVNNFSELNKDLIIELKEEIQNGNFDEVKAIADNLAVNEEKINYHGKRADGIVKGMLQHSRTSSGQKEATDINQLCDEYLRLAYHGLRAKDKSFNASFETDFSTGINKMQVVPQDIGRVLLNLINNAFYAVSEKRTHSGENYKPVVKVSTRMTEQNGKQRVIISVKDNGVGISPAIQDKILQPFFTTKPTGKGTGLGLSLSYEIIKAHAGELKVFSKESEGSEFVVELPVE